MLNKLSPQPGSKKNRKRVGRGSGSTGKTSGKGHKGQNSRTGGGVSPWFEGGQTPLKMRTPKRGFTSRNKLVFDLIQVKDLSKFSEGDTVTPAELIKAGLASGKKPIKILANGDMPFALTIKADAFSKGAIIKIEEKGGKAEAI
ncbi:MAG: 50S ribosomal protein L15 [Thermodesulfobacteriota bacterium]|nr:MAG: 50S ribosomal protein L15 [Thermodesulfobacteriota bacterium]